MVSKAQLIFFDLVKCTDKDAAPFTGTPEQAYRNLRLDYNGTPYKGNDMNLSGIQPLKDEIKGGFVIAIGEKVFKHISKEDDRYIDGRAALDACWKWVEDGNISGDELYELIDNAECTGISEFAEYEQDIYLAKLWCLLVDIVSYIAWMEYKKEKTRYLPQALEGIREESLLVLAESAVETSFITEEEISLIQNRILSCLDTI